VPPACAIGSTLVGIRPVDRSNDPKRGLEASLVTSMGRLEAHTGRIVTYDQIFHSKNECAPMVDKLRMNGPAPVMSDAKGRCPVPQLGIVTDQEYWV
jgi:hypothetical protein